MERRTAVNKSAAARPVNHPQRRYPIIRAASPKCHLAGAPKRFDIAMMGGRSGSLGTDTARGVLTTAWAYGVASLVIGSAKLHFFRHGHSFGQRRYNYARIGH